MVEEHILYTLLTAACNANVQSLRNSLTGTVLTIRSHDLHQFVHLKQTAIEGFVLLYFCCMVSTVGLLGGIWVKLNLKGQGKNVQIKSVCIHIVMYPNDELENWMQILRKKKTQKF